MAPSSCGGIPAGKAVNLLVNARGFEPTVSADYAFAGDARGITVYAVRTWVTSFGGTALTMSTGIVGNPLVGETVDRRLGLMIGLVVDSRSGEGLPGASVQLVGRGEVGEQIQHLVDTEKLTFTSPSVGYPVVTGGFIIPNIPAGETLDLIPTRTGSPHTGPNYEFEPTGVVSVPGALTFVVLPAVKAKDPRRPGLLALAYLLLQRHRGDRRLVPATNAASVHQPLPPRPRPRNRDQRLRC